MIVAEPRTPIGKRTRNGIAKTFTAFEFDTMPLAVVEAERFDRFVSIERPGKTRGRILAAGKQHQRATLRVFAGHRENSVNAQWIQTWLSND